MEGKVQFSLRFAFKGPVPFSAILAIKDDFHLPRVDIHHGHLRPRIGGAEVEQGLDVVVLFNKGLHS